MKPHIELDLNGADLIGGDLTVPRIYQICEYVLGQLDLAGGPIHLAIEFVTEHRIRKLNRQFRDKDAPTDVLSFPIDELTTQEGPRELGDVIICSQHSQDLTQVVVHGILHLAGMDHETDQGEMLAFEAKLLTALAEIPPEAELGQSSASEGAGKRSGFIVLVGRPNVGKSTLLNALLGEKVAIISDKPQTTRRALRGVITDGNDQVVLTDLPGVQKPLDELTRRMQRRVEQELGDADGILLMLNGKQGVGPGDRFIANLIQKSGVPALAAVNKTDLITKDALLKVLGQVSELGLDLETFPISAVDGEGLDRLQEGLKSLLKPGEFYFDPTQTSDLPRDLLIAELVREQALLRTRQEVPHALEVQVEETDRSSNGKLVIYANLIVETDSQKGILVGRQGRMIKAIGSAARSEIEKSLGHGIYLDLSVKVRQDWRSQDDVLDVLGFE